MDGRNIEHRLIAEKWKKHIIIIIIIINPLTARMFLQPVFSIFPCSQLPSGTCRTPGLSIPWCCLPTSSSVCLVFFPLSLCLARRLIQTYMPAACTGNPVTEASVHSICSWNWWRNVFSSSESTYMQTLPLLFHLELPQSPFRLFLDSIVKQY